MDERPLFIKAHLVNIRLISNLLPLLKLISRLQATVGSRLTTVAMMAIIWANYNDQPAEVTLNGGLVRELPQNPLNSGLGILLICPETNMSFFQLWFGQMRGS